MPAPNTATFEDLPEDLLLKVVQDLKLDNPYEYVRLATVNRMFQRILCRPESWGRLDCYEVKDESVEDALFQTTTNKLAEAARMGVKELQVFHVNPTWFSFPNLLHLQNLTLAGKPFDPPLGKLCCEQWPRLETLEIWSLGSTWADEEAGVGEWTSLTKLNMYGEDWQPFHHHLFRQCTNVRVLKGTGIVPPTSQYPCLEEIIWECGYEEGGVEEGYDEDEQEAFLAFVQSYSRAGRPLRGKYRDMRNATWTDLETGRQIIPRRGDDLPPVSLLEVSEFDPAA